MKAAMFESLAGGKASSETGAERKESLWEEGS